MTRPEPGDEENFMERLQTRLDDMLEDPNPPDAPTIDITI